MFFYLSNFLLSEFFFLFASLSNLFASWIWLVRLRDFCVLLIYFLFPGKKIKLQVWNLHSVVSSCSKIYFSILTNALLSLKVKQLAYYLETLCMEWYWLIYTELFAEFWTYVEKSFTWTDLPSKFPTKYVQFPVSHFLFFFSPFSFTLHARDQVCVMYTLAFLFL